MSLIIQKENNYENYGMNAAEKEETKTNKQEKAEGVKKSDSIFAGDLNLMESPIEKKRKEAKKQAMKLIQDAWANEQKIDESVSERKYHYEKMKEQKGSAQKELNDINSNREELKEAYGITDDSEEQKDLELLERRQDVNNGFGPPLTEAEKEKLKEIDKKPLTEYQQRMLEYNDVSAKFRKEVEEADAGMKDDAGDMRAIMIERLKTHPMVDAQKAADKIMKAASKEIVGMMVDEAREEMDKKAEEEKEKTEEKKEENKEKEEKLEDLREKIAIQEALIEGTKEAMEEAKKEVKRNNEPEIDMDDMIDIAKGYKNPEEVQKGLADIKNNMKILEADLKGIKIDEEV
ncbi:MAG: HD-GYP domain protein [Lachnospiraceae bacterium]|nr:HD-GYP domain protein [Lachnospiraceae bacterium]